MSCLSAKNANVKEVVNASGFAGEVGSCPPAKVLNIKEAGDATRLAGEFGLERIKIIFISLSPHEFKAFTVAPGHVHFTFVVRASATLKARSSTQPLAPWDSFGFPCMRNEIEYIISFGSKGADLLIFEDKSASDFHSRDDLSDVPTIVHAEDVSRIIGSGQLSIKTSPLTYHSDVKKKRKNDSEPEVHNAWNVNLQIVPPGSMSSMAHCHSHEEEFAFVLSGAARYWHHGQVPEPILKPGDCIGWKPATGIAHTLINDGEDPNGKGEPFIFLIFGEYIRPDDKLFYPGRSDEVYRKNRRWPEDTRPKIPWGPANMNPRYSRQEETET